MAARKCLINTTLLSILYVILLTTPLNATVSFRDWVPFLNSLRTTPLSTYTRYGKIAYPGDDLFPDRPQVKPLLPPEDQDKAQIEYDKATYKRLKLQGGPMFAVTTTTTTIAPLTTTRKANGVSCGKRMCYNGGDCVEVEVNGEPKRYLCACPDTFIGRDCSIPMPDCAYAKCSRIKSCFPGTDTGGAGAAATARNEPVKPYAVCLCKRGRTFSTCTMATMDWKSYNELVAHPLVFVPLVEYNKIKAWKNPCDLRPCKYGGTCKNMRYNLFICVCPYKSQGARCEQETQQSEGVRYCQKTPKGPLCINNDVWSYPMSVSKPSAITSRYQTTQAVSLVTPNALFADVITQSASSPCDENPCKNGGTCTSHPDMTSGAFLCVCPVTQAGIKCEKARDDCVVLSCTTISECTYLADGPFCICNAPSFSEVCRLSNLNLTPIEKVVEFDESVRFGPIFFSFILGLYGIVTMFLYCKLLGVSDEASTLRKKYKRQLMDEETPSEPPPDTLDVFKSKLPCCASSSTPKQGRSIKKHHSDRSLASVKSGSSQQINNNRVSRDPSQTNMPPGRHDNRYTFTYPALPRQRSATVYQHETSLTSPVAVKGSQKRRSHSRSEGRSKEGKTYRCTRCACNPRKSYSKHEAFPKDTYSWTVTTDTDTDEGHDVIIPLIKDEQLRQRASANYGSNNAACYGHSSTNNDSEGRKPCLPKHHLTTNSKYKTLNDCRPNSRTRALNIRSKCRHDCECVPSNKHVFRRHTSNPYIKLSYVPRQSDNCETQSVCQCREEEVTPAYVHVSTTD